jgi:hypothetical protein
MGKAWAKFVKMILCTFIFGKSFLKRMDGHVIALKENVLGIGGINIKNTLSLCDIIISWVCIVRLKPSDFDNLPKFLQDKARKLSNVVENLMN